MKFTFFYSLLPVLGSAFHASTPTPILRQNSLNAVSPAKNKYNDNPFIYKAKDENGLVKELFNTQEVFTKTAEMDFSKMPLDDDQSDYHCVVTILDRDTILAVLRAYEREGRF